MDALSALPSDREEIALRRWELLSDLRDARKRDWRQYWTLFVHFVVTGWSLYWASRMPVTQLTVFLLMIPTAQLVWGYVHFVVTPLKRRIAALEKLLEAEVKRQR